MQFEPGDRRRVLPRHLRPAPAPEIFSYTIRAVRPADLPHVREIYNHFVSNSAVTLDERRSSIPYWRDKYALLTRLELPFLVAASSGGAVIGYALAQPWAGKNAYKYTVEDSIYLGPGAGGKGLGAALLQALIDECEQIGLREMVAVISDHGAEASIRLHEKLGFVEAGRMGRVGYKFGRDLGTVYMRRVLKPTGRRRGSLFGSRR
ncbi:MULTISPECIES: GNAT family N-acetyltransferase [unclassified Microbacterium]|uniref:GNAT family N-acetyltransferase n=1 Tax=unclassified Microbacterium TaxID=2609290 RepID=UPI000CFBE69F|nr:MULTISPECIES: GNAT family N-acetyltransferase [unclassified Microbacterium]PQZ53339.1 N-acetyltransferase family protein [Microbacterium sp. MYb43]PQZ75027.1 N-acetyltransferase family protein [Microbacterium sp. MYb40]PRB19351.1 N-acetyltransferase family protein [Microbacterium sp. MYb54]PRB24552.1 N-acetyltransferase family protein [Microbacterium sp. MYb50]PRB63397.1 N-acetyltransferase family protein [Microbacterium sp. MYb24]